jgi:hypothetical protein
MVATASEETTMPYIVADHFVADAERFWSGAAAAVPNLPAGVTLHATYPQHDGLRAICLWEADSVEAVRKIVEDSVGGSARNEFFEVDSQHAFALGLPARARATT